MNNCTQCNFGNSPNARFCNNCGTNLATADALPPTVFGGQMPMPAAPPEAFQNQPNSFQNQPDSFQNQPNFAPPIHQPVAVAPKKSVVPKILLIVGGIVVLGVLGVFGMFVYEKTLGSYFYKQRLEKEFREKQSQAGLLAAKDLLPERITTIRTQQTVSRGQMLDKAQLVEVIKTKMPQLNSEAKNINDAAAALYATPDKRQALLQVFKYNTADQAKNACQEIGREMIKNKDNFVNSPYFGYDDRPGFCYISGDTKTGDSVSVNSLYGFLYMTTGYKDYSTELNSSVWNKLR